MFEDDFGLVIKPSISIREQIHKRISELIFSGRIGPRERIVEAKLAEHLGVSRTPVREALHVLEREGVLEAIPRVGYQVKEIRWEEVLEICEIRKANESLAVRWAIARITAAEVNAIEKCLAASEERIRSGNLDRFIHHDAEFHQLIARSSRSSRLFEICQILHRNMFLYRVQSLREPSEAINALKGHRVIFERIRDRDEAGAVTAINEHLDFVQTNVREYTSGMIGAARR